MSNQLILFMVIVAAVAAYIGIMMLLPKKYTNPTSQHLKSAMQRLKEQRDNGVGVGAASSDVVYKNIEENVLVKAYLSLPFVTGEMALIEQAGLLEYFDRVIMAGIGLLLVVFLITYPYGMISILLAPTITCFVLYFYIRGCARKRRKKFLDLFPDALDIIVRSVKAGYPINNSIAMVADSMPEVIGREYTRIVNEAAYGYTLAEAVNRFAERINQPDVYFFAVVVSVQQETGGNLSEVLANLSNVIRQRKHLRLKVGALSAEGRMTVVVLIGIAFFMVLLVYFFKPSHFEPLLHTPVGHTVMTTIGCIFVATFFVIRKIIHFKI